MRTKFSRVEGALPFTRVGRGSRNIRSMRSTMLFFDGGKRQIVITVNRIIATIIVITRFTRVTFHARSLEVRSYHPDEPMYLFFVCSYDLKSSAPVQTRNRNKHCVCMHVFRFIRITIATSVNVASFASYASVASVTEWSHRHSCSISSCTYTMHRSVSRVKASPYARCSADFAPWML